MTPEDARARTFMIWAGAFILLHIVGFFVVLGFDPRGMDACGLEGEPNRAGQSIAASVTTLIAAVLAVWKVRRWYLVPAVGFLATAAFVWVWILSEAGQTC